ncbi:UNVERIFIED_CONTAM: hypothetical protein GTU68_001893 [Idotea baltica]|nr:hypothetical protein [Idotea baltica]
MIVATVDTMPGYAVEEVFGLVRGATVRAGHLGGDLSAFLTNLVGGEVSEYTKLLAEAREQALDRMSAEAKALGANAVIGTRFAGTEIAAGAAEMLVYGTAVRLAKLPG